MKKRVGILGLFLAVALGLCHPAAASAQDRNDYRRGYGYQDYRSYPQRDHGWREDHERHERNEGRGDYDRQNWREARERQEWREHEWRERERYERRYAPGYSYGYGDPGLGIQFGWYGR